jgi:hypothetical protein
MRVDAPECGGPRCQPCRPTTSRPHGDTPTGLVRARRSPMPRSSTTSKGGSRVTRPERTDESGELGDRLSRRGSRTRRTRCPLPPARTASVHHRCITRTQLDALLQHHQEPDDRIAETNQAVLTGAGRRIRLRGLLRKSPAFAGLFYSWRMGVHHPCITLDAVRPCRTPIGFAHSQTKSATLSAYLTVVRGRSEPMTMQKRRQGSTLCLLATRFGSLTLTRNRCG